MLTARHVVFPEDRDGSKPIRLVWKREDESEPFHHADVSSIEFDSEKFDVAVLVCDTSKLALPPIILVDGGLFPTDGKRWKSHGYPTAGRERGVRIKNPACGSFQPANPSHYVQWLNSDGDVTDNALWQGMSGAPVFDENDRLVAVIIQTPAEYKDEQGNLKPEFHGRLLAASIPYLLLPGKCVGFNEAISKQKLAEELLPTPKTADDFEQWLVDELSEELRSLQSKTSVLHEQLCKELGLTVRVESNNIEANSLIATALLKKHDFESAVDFLAAATSECLLEGRRRYSPQSPLEQLRTTAESVLGWLVLRAIDESQLQTILPVCTHRSSLFFRLKGIQSLTGIEIAMARRFNRKPNFNSQYDSEHESCYRITLPEGLFKWDGEESVRRVFIEIWNRVIQVPSKRKELHDNYTLDDIRYLNRQLAKRRAHRRYPEHFYLSFTEKDCKDGKGCADFILGIYQDLLSKLHEMTVIEYGGGGEQSILFVIPEEDIRTTIDLFYEEINGKLGNKA